MADHNKITITQAPGIVYPDADSFSPHEYYPEYPFPWKPSANQAKNHVYSLVRQCLFESGADRENFGTPRWNPLGAWIKTGQRVVVLPNLVMHRRGYETEEAFQGKCTDGSVIRAVLDYVTIATGDLRSVSFGNAPLQGCDHRRVIEEARALNVAHFYREMGNPDPGPHDFRLLVTRWNRLGALLSCEIRGGNEGVMVDLGRESLLDDLFRDSPVAPQVRVGDYPGDETMKYHAPGRHEYILHRRILEADVIVSVPKLKTHQKVGITCALKGTVGTIGRKECLAHHRLGPPATGGDEFPIDGVLARLASRLDDTVPSLGISPLANGARVLAKVMTRAAQLGRNVMWGAWHGNDTAWRMTLDIARILRSADRQGRLQPKPVRRHLAFVDGIVAGEGEGPLRPRPRQTGLVLFSPDPVAADFACALLMGYDPLRMKLIAEAFKLRNFPLTEAHPQEIRLLFNGLPVSAERLAGTLSPPFKTPKGWRGSLELRSR